MSHDNNLQTSGINFMLEIKKIIRKAKKDKSKMKEKFSLKKDFILDIFPSCILIIVLSVLVAPGNRQYKFH